MDGIVAILRAPVEGLRVAGAPSGPASSTVTSFDTMKRISVAASLLATLLALSGCQDPGSSAVPSASASAKGYPLDVCIVSGEKLGSMGEPIVLVHQGQEVKFCCKSCKPDFEKEPAKFLAKLATKK